MADTDDDLDYMVEWFTSVVDTYPDLNDAANAVEHPILRAVLADAAKVNDRDVASLVARFAAALNGIQNPN